MQLSRRMLTELDRRLEAKRRERSRDPAFDPLPMGDWIALAAIFVLALGAALLKGAW